MVIAGSKVAGSNNIRKKIIFFSPIKQWLFCSDVYHPHSALVTQGLIDKAAGTPEAFLARKTFDTVGSVNFYSLYK